MRDMPAALLRVRVRSNDGLLTQLTCVAARDARKDDEAHFNKQEQKSPCTPMAFDASISLVSQNSVSLRTVLFYFLSANGADLGRDHQRNADFPSFLVVLSSSSSSSSSSPHC